jgi:hypothetical protein
MSQYSQFTKRALLPSDVNILTSFLISEYKLFCLDKRTFVGNVIVDVGYSREVSETRPDLVPIEGS